MPAMFSGIIEALGEVRTIEDEPSGYRMRIEAPAIANEVSPGQSVAVDGACLTVEDRDDASFSVFLATETIDRTTFGDYHPGRSVNLERSMPANGRFDGHLVQGHVDGTGTIQAVEERGEDWWYRLSVPAQLDRYVVEKGSIAIDGISLTVAAVADGDVAVTIIPTTLMNTTIKQRTPGDHVNIEVDIVAKYVESLCPGGPDD